MGQERSVHFMFAEILFVSGLLAAQPPTLPDQLVLSVVVTDKKGKADYVDLTPAEVTVNGRLREPAGDAPGARRPSAGGGAGPRHQREHRQHLCLRCRAGGPGVHQATYRKDRGTRIWTTSDRPKVLVELGAAPISRPPKSKLRSTPALGQQRRGRDPGAGLAGGRPRPRAPVGGRAGDLRDHGRRAVPTCRRCCHRRRLRPTYIAVEFVQGGGQGDARLEDAIKFLVGPDRRQPRARLLGDGHRHAVAQGDRSARTRSTGWRGSQQTDPRQTKIEVKVSRKDAKVVQAQRLSTTW